MPAIAAQYFKVTLPDGTILSVRGDKHPALLTLHFPKTKEQVSFDFDPARTLPTNPAILDQLRVSPMPSPPVAPSTTERVTLAAGTVSFGAALADGTRPMDPTP